MAIQYKLIINKYIKGQYRVDSISVSKSPSTGTGPRHRGSTQCLQHVFVSKSPSTGTGPWFKRFHSMFQSVVVSKSPSTGTGPWFKRFHSMSRVSLWVKVLAQGPGLGIEVPLNVSSISSASVFRTYIQYVQGHGQAPVYIKINFFSI